MRHLRQSRHGTCSVVSFASGYRSDILICWDLVEQFGQHGRIADVAAGNLDGPDLQRLLINSDVYLSPDAPLGAAVLARVPFAFALGLDAIAVDQQVQRDRAAAVKNGRVQRSLAAAQSAGVRHPPVQPDQAQKALDEPGRLSQRHAKQHLHGQTSLDRSVAETWLSPALPRRRRSPHHVGIKPNRQRSKLPECFIVS